VVQDEGRKFPQRTAEVLAMPTSDHVAASHDALRAGTMILARTVLD